jgi:hypothetical protein
MGGTYDYFLLSFEYCTQVSPMRHITRDYYGVWGLYKNTQYQTEFQLTVINFPTSSEVKGSFLQIHFLLYRTLNKYCPSTSEDKSYDLLNWCLLVSRFSTNIRENCCLRIEG